MYPSLPQHDPQIAERTRALADLRHEYIYDYDTIPGRAMAEKVPFKNEFAFELLMEVAGRQTVVMLNSRGAPREDKHADHHESLWTRTTKFVKKLEGNAEHFLPEKVGDLLHQFFGSLSKRYSLSDSTELRQFEMMFRDIKAPPIAEVYHEDRMFAHMRLAGPNPMMLKRMTAMDDRFPIDNAAYRKVAGENDSLESALKEGRLYMADYGALEKVQTGEFKGLQKYITAPLAMFYVPVRKDGSRGELMPVAIQCGQIPSAESPLIQPHHGHAWLMARNLVQVADGNLHQAVVHLGRTHIFLEPFVIATLRRLSPQHPLYLLLDAHFEGTLAINNAAHKTLLAPDGVVDHILAGTLAASVGLAVDDLKNYPANEVLDPRATFVERGVEDAELLPGYSYRDDALPIWDAIREWVTEYLDLYYQSDADVKNDTELQAWAAELVSPDGGRVIGLGEDGAGKITTRDYLKSLVAMLIFKAGPEHAAVNFPQKDLMSYVPNMPLAAYAPPPAQTEGLSEADYVAMLPPIDAAYMQLDTGYLLGGVHHTQLGQYGKKYFKDPRLEPALARFQKRLAEIEVEISERNKDRLIDYHYLLPSQIPQSVNI
ncbi:MAG: lipoxygenase [bacterium]|nr:lipoxygenase [bacterium]